MGGQNCVPSSVWTSFYRIGGNEPACGFPVAPVALSDDRVGYRGLRPGTLPHHRTYGFPYPAVGPSGLTACRKTGRSPKATACRTSCTAFCQGFRGSRSGSRRRRPAAAPPHLPSPAPRLVPPAGKVLPARDSGKPLRRCARFSSSLLFSPRGAAKCVRGPSVRGARRLTSGGVLGQSVEHGEQAQRSNGGPIACFGRQVVRNAG